MIQTFQESARLPRVSASGQETRPLAILSPRGAGVLRHQTLHKAENSSLTDWRLLEEEKALGGDPGDQEKAPAVTQASKASRSCDHSADVAMVGVDPCHQRLIAAGVICQWEPGALVLCL